MARDYEFINGPETSEVPTASDAVLDSETPSYGQVKKEFTSRQSIGNSVSTIVALKALLTQAGAPFERVADQVLQVNSRDSFYRWVPTSLLASDDFVIVRPNDIASDASAGRWILVNTVQPTFLDDTAANNFYGAKLVKGATYFDDTAKKQKVYNGTAWIISGGGGVGSASVFALLNSDDDLTTWASGNNASFLGGGTLAGTFNKQDSTNPLSGLKSYSYTQAAGSLNDYISSAAIDVPIRSRGKEVGVNFPFTYDGADNDIKAIVYDVTNSVILSSSLDLVKKSNGSSNNQLVQIFIPSNCAQIRFGFQVLVANSGKILRFDDVEFNDSPLIYKNQMLKDSISYIGYSGKDASNRVLFTSKDNLRLDSSGIISDSNSGYTKFTVLKDCQVNISLGAGNASLSNNETYIVHYNASGTVIKRSPLFSGSNAWELTSSMSTKALVGDYFLVISSLALGGVSALDTYFSIIAFTESDSVLTPMRTPKQIDISSYVSASGFTVTRAVAIYYKTGDGASRLVFNIKGTMATASRTGVTLTVSGLNFKTFTDANAPRQAFTFDTDGVAVDGRRNYATSNTLVMLHTSASTSGYSLSGDVELDGKPTWADDVSSQYMAAVPTLRTAIIQYRGNGTRTTLTTTPVAMPLNTVKGNSEILSIASNQFTLWPGEYEIDASAAILLVSGNQSAFNFFYNVTDSIEVDRGLESYTQSSIAGAILSSRAAARITINSPKTFEWRWLISGAGVVYLGNTTAAPNDLNGFIKVTKIR